MSQARAPEPELSPLTQQLLAGTGQDIKDMQRNALTKQYDVSLRLTVVEADGKKAFYDSGNMTWNGTPYPFVVAIETALVDLLQKLTVAGAEITTGGGFTPPA